MITKEEWMDIGLNLNRSGKIRPGSVSLTIHIFRGQIVGLLRYRNIEQRTLST